MSTADGDDTSGFYENNGCFISPVNLMRGFQFNWFLMTLQSVLLKLPELQFGRCPCISREKNHILPIPKVSEGK